MGWQTGMIVKMSFHHSSPSHYSIGPIPIAMDRHPSNLPPSIRTHLTCGTQWSKLTQDIGACCPDRYEGGGDGDRGEGEEGRRWPEGRRWIQEEIRVSVGEGRPPVPGGPHWPLPQVGPLRPARRRPSSPYDQYMKFNHPHGGRWNIFLINVLNILWPMLLS